MRDIALAVRGLRRAPVFAVVAIASLAVAIGAGSAIFAVVDAVLLRPPQGIERPGRLASIYFNRVADPGVFSAVSWPDFEDLRRDARSFSGLLAYLRLSVAVDTGGRTADVSGELVSESYFRVLGTPLRLGRDFRADEREPVVLIGEGFWQQRFGGDPGVIGRPMRIGGRAFTIVGVVPRAFRGVVLDWGDPPQLWIPMRFHRDAVPALAAVDVMHGGAMRSFLVTGRLADGVTVSQAAAEIETLARRIGTAHPGRPRGEPDAWTARVVPVQQARFWPGARTQIVTVLVVLLAVAAGVLAIACANVASLLLTRAAQREREITVRLALGAGAGAMLRLLLAESAVIAAAGCAGGPLVAAGLTRGLASFPTLFAIPLALDLTVDWRVTAFGVAVAAAVSVITGTAPLRQWRRRDLTASLRGIGAAAAAGSRRWSARNLLVAAQIGMSLALMVHAGLLLRTFRNAAEADPFLRAGNLLVARVTVPSTARSPEIRTAIARELPQRLRDLPPVQMAVLASTLPMSGMRAAADLEILDPAGGGGIQENLEFNAVTPGYFELAGSTLAQGRTFTQADRADRPAVAVVNQALADRYWKGDAVGRRLRSGGTEVTVVGIVRDATRRSYRLDVPPRVYFVLPQRTAGSLYVAVRTHGNPMTVLPAVQAALAGISPEASLDSPQTLASYTSVVLAQERLAAWCLGALAAIALLLSVCGIYGTVAYAVAQRRKEIGIRVALGAGSLDVVTAIVGPTAQVSAGGLAAGSLLCVAGLRVSEPMLFGVSGLAPSVWAGATAVLVGTALLSAVIPAFIASRVDAARAIRAS